MGGKLLTNPRSISMWKTGIVALVLATSCVGGKEGIREALKEDPSILTDAMRANPVEFFEALSEVAGNARKQMQERKAQKELEDGIKNPRVANIRPDEAIRGTKGAPLTLVEYSDFECPYCTRGFQTVRAMLKKYEGKIQFVYKHLPLSFHPNAMIAGQYYEAARLQGHDKAFKLHDEIFANQSKLKGGEKFLKKLAKKVGLDVRRLARDAKKKEIIARIKEDMAEAAKFGFKGTPGFLINGVPVRGALPAEHFDRIIEKLVEMGKVKL